MTLGWCCRDCDKAIIRRQVPPHEAGRTYWDGERWVTLREGAAPPATPQDELHQEQHKTAGGAGEKR